MRTKTLLLAAAALAVSLVTSQAQSPVYSANIVGYINYSLQPNGFTLLANQLDFDGHVTNNSVNTVFGTNLLGGTTVYAWAPSSATFHQATWATGKKGLAWSGDTNDVNLALNGGVGVFVQDTSGTTQSVTTVGNVLQGSYTNILTPGVEVLVSSPIPLSGEIKTNLDYVPNLGDSVFEWSPSAQGFQQTTYATGKKGNAWNVYDPNLGVGQAFFLTPGSATTNWVVTFTAQ